MGGTKPIKVDAASSHHQPQCPAGHRGQGPTRRPLLPPERDPHPAPPLRERKEDILPLATHFLSKFCLENHIALKKLSKSAEGALVDYKWPGNVRELSNIMERASVIEPGPEITPDSLSLNQIRPAQTAEKGEIPGVESITIPIGVTLGELEKKLIIETLAANNMNRTKTAHMLNISIRTLRNKLHEYQVE